MPLGVVGCGGGGGGGLTRLNFDRPGGGEEDGMVGVGGAGGTVVVAVGAVVVTAVAWEESGEVGAEEAERLRLRVRLALHAGRSAAHRVYMARVRREGG